MASEPSNPNPADVIELVSALNRAAVAGLKVPSHTDAFGSASRAEFLANWILGVKISPADAREVLVEKVVAKAILSQDLDADFNAEEAESHEGGLPGPLKVVHFRVMQSLRSDSAASRSATLTQAEISETNGLSLEAVSDALGALRVMGYATCETLPPSRSGKEKHWLTPKGHDLLARIGQSSPSRAVSVASFT
jgi:hypothetical protein